MKQPDKINECNTQMKWRLTISIVTHNNEETIKNTLESIQKSTLTPGSYHVNVVDNDSTDQTVELIHTHFPWVQVILSQNIGFGAGHNKALQPIIGQSQYHLVMNPDVYFDPPVLEVLLQAMDSREDVGLISPKILYPDHRLQYLCKLLPTPFDSIARRFIPGLIKPLFQKRFDRYEMRDHDYNQVMEVPHLSGCFMLLRSSVFQVVGLFDERFFMYLEDVDFSRRVLASYKNLYYPYTHIFHHYHKGSYKGKKLLKHHIISAVKYFNKWGWFFDKQRKCLNRIPGSNACTD